MSDRCIRVKLTKTIGPDQYPEHGLFKVPPDEARLLIRALAIQLAQEQVKTSGSTAPKEQVIEESSRVLGDIEDEIERMYGRI